MSGPNQLGLWLLMPIAIAIAKIQESKKQGIQTISKSSICKKLPVWHLDFGCSLYLGVCILELIALILTFSRAAWIGAAVIVGITLWPVLRSLSRRTAICLLSSAFCFLVLVLVLFPAILLRAASSRGHIENPLKAIQMMIDHPFGLGLGKAGPASNRTSDACVLLDAGADVSWASDRPNLCVFVDSVQVQPLDRVCSCPFLPENWYLQIGVEMGWMGMLIFMILVVMVVVRLLDVASYELREREATRILAARSFLFCFVGLSVAALFLHAWEDSAVAYTIWILIAILLRFDRLSR
jgi:O-antigen ligase